MALVRGFIGVTGYDREARGMSLPQPSTVRSDTHGHSAPILGMACLPGIDWPQIEAHVPDVRRVVLSVRAGRLLPPAILRRLATYSRKNRPYFAFREPGRYPDRLPAPLSRLGRIAPRHRRRHERE